MQELTENKKHHTTIFMTDECFKKVEIVLTHSEIRCHLKFENDIESQKYFNGLIEGIKKSNGVDR